MNVNKYNLWACFRCKILSSSWNIPKISHSIVGRRKKEYTQQNDNKKTLCLDAHGLEIGLKRFKSYVTDADAMLNIISILVAHFLLVYFGYGAI